MATLVLPQSSGYPLPRTPRISLRAWLNDSWAVLFSHPDDFVECEMEQDRWLAILQRSFAEQRVRPLALSRPAQPVDAGWVTRLSGDPGLVLLEDASEYFGLHARQLREGILAAGSRFVMILDSMLVRRKTYTYSDPSRLPSPLDFLACIRTLRARSEPVAAPEPHAATMPSWDQAPAPRRSPARASWITA